MADAIRRKRPRSDRVRSRPPAPARYTLGEAIARRWHAQPYDPFDQRLKQGTWDTSLPDPVRRTLAVYTQDPTTSRMDVATADVRVPYEPLQAGPCGCVIRVIDENRTTGEQYEPLDLDRLKAGHATGMRPSTMDPRFAQQMVYAVSMATYDRFRQALGRTPDFAFEPHASGPHADPEPRMTLHAYPHAMEEDNAYYDPGEGALLFGYTYAGAAAAGLNQAGGVVFTSLSHDVVVHEMTHALLDGMRAQFMLPTNPDVDAFHEAFADLVAIFQRFQYRELVARGVAQGGGELTSRLLTDIARQWGQATGDGRSALRTAMLAAGGADDPVAAPHRYGPDKEAHDLGAVLVAAVFDAFRWIFERKTARLRRLCGGADVRYSPDLIELLTDEATKLAGQFLSIVIRAVDYCPPVDLTFGEYLRAIVTADYDLVPEDPWGYREAFVQAFRRYGITVGDVADLSEDALLWRPPEHHLGRIPGLDFPSLRHGRDPGQIGTRDELKRRADALGEFVTRPDNLYSFGLAVPRRSRTEPIDPPVVESVHTLRRISPDGGLNFDLVAEVLQRRKTSGGRWFHGGSTIIVDSDGSVRYAISKYVRSARREDRIARRLQSASELERQCFTDNPPGRALLVRRLHQRDKG
ncbi:MAG TPA: hypothetical protein VLD67_18460 [Vicinamibacterales bacterium]|nr:hypothetical protein [Vicinamibacterales bacterium]